MTMTPPDFLMRVPPLKLHVRNATQTDSEPPMYELFCRLTAPQEKADGAPERVEWSLWKTYEEFQAFDHRMRASAASPFAKMMVTVTFAPVHRVRAFFGQDARPSFLEKRRAELDFFMQRIMLFPDVSEFNKPGAHGSRVLAEFIAAAQHMDCSELLGSGDGVSPTTTISSAAGGLRDSGNSNSMSSSRGLQFSSSHGPRVSGDSTQSMERQTMGGSTRRAYKLEIEEELTLRFGEHQLKRFKKRSRAFRKENDRVSAAKVFVAYLRKEFEPEFADWLLRTFVHSLKSEEERRALRTAGGISLPLGSHSSGDHSGDDDLRESQSKMDRYSHDEGDNPVATTRVSRKKANREILERVNKLARGDLQKVAAFKQAAKALGNREMSSDEFVSLVRDTLGRKHTAKLLLLVVDVVPDPQIQEDLRETLAA